MTKMDSSPSSSSGMIVHEVGTVKNGVKKPFLTAGSDGIEMREDVDTVRRRVRRSEDDISEIIIRKEMMDILQGIEEYSHLVVLYWAHKVPESSRALTRVHPMGREEFPLMGIFSTCSPARPNPVLMTVVRLHGRNENVITVSGLDAVDGSPIIDIKPFVKEFYIREDIRIPEWMQRIIEEMRGDMNDSEKCRHETAHGRGGCRRGGSSFNIHDPNHVFEELGLKTGDVFLDLGCGPGEYAVHASGRVGKSGIVYALERVESHIASLKQRADEESITNIQAVASDITGPLPIDDSCVDVCLMATVLHIPDVTQNAGALCAEIRRVLKPNGRLVVIECHKKKLPFGPPMHIRLSEEEVKELMTKCGFQVLSETDLGYNYLIQFVVKEEDSTPDRT